jgi:hypothetical protein
MGLISNGTTLLDAGALDSGIATGSMTLIKTLTASSSATLSFVDGASNVVLDSTYKEYVFKFIDIHAATDTAIFSFQGNASGGSGYDETITSSYFEAYHQENDGDTALAYNQSGDQAQGTGFQSLSQQGLGTASGEDDMCLVGSLRLFAPSDTTFVKHFLSDINYNDKSASVYSNNTFVGGYFNTTSAIDEIQFKMSSGDIASGTIKLYGIK